jgi:uncharacterized protein (TIGR04255 family)
MSNLPSFDKPPITEAAIGVQFLPLERAKNCDLWAFWSTIQDDYPRTEDQLPIDRKTEEFGPDVFKKSLKPHIAFASPAVRLRMLSDDQHHMIQLQNGRLVLNWRRLDDGIYPRWSFIYAEFKHRVEQFRQFVNNHNLGKFEIDQWELTYVNNFFEGEDWHSPIDWPKLLPGLLGDYSLFAFDNSLEAISNETVHAIPNSRARFYTDLKRASTTKSPSRDLLIFTLTCRGGVSNNWSFEQGLEFGRETIVTNFRLLTGSIAHAKWGLQQ